MGCDQNPDPGYMLAQYGLHQITNTSLNIGHPQIDSGLIAWTNGGFGMPITYRAYDISHRQHFGFPLPADQGSSRLHPHGCCILYSLTPIKNLGQDNQNGDYANDTVWIWNPLEDSRKQVSLPPGAFLTAEGRAGFDGTWALLLDYPLKKGYKDGATAVNVNTGEVRTLFEIRPTDGTYFGTPLLWRTLSKGSAFMAFYYENPDRTSRAVLQEVNLTTGESWARLELPGVIQQFDASDNYVVVGPGVKDGESLAVMSRQNNTWWDLDKTPRAQVAEPKVGGDWCVFEEMTRDDSGTMKLSLVAINIPTGKRFDLLPHDANMSLVSWDTDGQHVVVEAQLETQNPNVRYPGVQLYWMDLPNPSK